MDNRHIINKSNRLDYINTAKTLGISLVLFAHLTIPVFLTYFISCFSMPLFFLISGLLYTTKTYSYKQFIKHKFKALMYPYFFFAVFSFLFYVIIKRNAEEGINSSEDLIKYAIGILYAPASKEYLGFNIPIWFLPCLFTGEIIFFAMVRHLKKHIFPISVLLFVLGIIVKETVPFRLPWGADVSLFAIIFICIGYLSRKHDFINKHLTIKTISQKYIVLALSFSATVILLYFNSKGGTISVYQLHFNNYILFFINSLSGILFILTLSMIIPPLRVMNFFGRNTIILLGLHLLIFSLLKGIQVFIFEIPLSVLDNNFTYNFVYLIATMLVCIPIILVINKYCPYIIGRKRPILQ